MGTKPHEIRPVQAKKLKFPSRFTPKTQPNSLRSGKGYRGGPTIETNLVNHPGIEPRNFSRQLERRYRPILAYAIQGSLRKVWRQSVVGVNVSVKTGFRVTRRFYVKPYVKPRVRITGLVGQTLKMANRIGRAESHPGAYLRRYAYQYSYRAARKKKVWALYTAVGRRKFKREVRSTTEINRRATRAVTKHIDPRRRTYGVRYTRRW